MIPSHLTAAGNPSRVARAKPAAAQPAPTRRAAVGRHPGWGWWLE